MNTHFSVLSDLVKLSTRADVGNIVLVMPWYGRGYGLHPDFDRQMIREAEALRNIIIYPDMYIYIYILIYIYIYPATKGGLEGYFLLSPILRVLTTGKYLKCGDVCLEQ